MKTTFGVLLVLLLAFAGRSGPAYAQQQRKDKAGRFVALVEGRFSPAVGDALLQAEREKRKVAYAMCLARGPELRDAEKTLDILKASDCVVISYTIPQGVNPPFFTRDGKKLEFTKSQGGFIEVWIYDSTVENREKYLSAIFSPDPAEQAKAMREFIKDLRDAVRPQARTGSSPLTGATSDAAALPMEIWTDDKGRAIEAAAVSWDGSMATLRKKNGQISSVPAAVLSEENRKRLEERFPGAALRISATDDAALEAAVGKRVNVTAPAPPAFRYWSRGTEQLVPLTKQFYYSMSGAMLEDFGVNIRSVGSVTGILEKESVEAMDDSDAGEALTVLDGVYTIKVTNYRQLAPYSTPPTPQSPAKPGR